ncbi:MAG: chemotaxis protein CheW [Burkholderiaceae bacterium]|nr:chemotaxis protein CheW [Burkholderiaceae bacterium]
MHRTDTPVAQASPAKAAETPPRQYLSFRLGGLEYGIDIRTVRELRPLAALEQVAGEGDVVVKGVVVSRGVIMPLVDMRAAFGGGLPGARQTDVIILELSSCVMGMVVDDVTDIVDLAGAAIVPIPGAPPNTDYLIGLGQLGERQLILLDIDKLMSIRKPGVPLTPPAPPTARAVPATPLPAAPDPS